jgi:DNA processing protein
MQDAELGAWLRLSVTPGVGNATARKLLTAFGLPEAVFAQSPAALAAVVGPKLAAALLAPPEAWSALCDTTRCWLAESRHHLVTLGDPAYPPELLQTEDPPLLLHVLGELNTLQHPRRVAMVGSRNPTHQGAENAHHFAQALAEAGVCVVSGLALGVDGAAHQGALDGGGPTLAVVGTGLDRVYPKRHLTLAHRIAEHGALISEYVLGTPPLSPNFPKRNRIISGLSQGTLVVEATLQSGSLITARLAAEQGREVFAIPGSIHAPQSKGCHALIRQGAKLVESAQDILEDLHLASPPPMAALASDPQASEPTPALLDALGHDPIGLDAIQARTGLDTSTLQAQLLELELDGWLARLPGGLFQRTGRG